MLKAGCLKQALARFEISEQQPKTCTHAPRRFLDAPTIISCASFHLAFILGVLKYWLDERLWLIAFRVTDKAIVFEHLVLCIYIEKDMYCTAFPYCLLDRFVRNITAGRTKIMRHLLCQCIHINLKSSTFCLAILLLKHMLYHSRKAVIFTEHPVVIHCDSQTSYHTLPKTWRTKPNMICPSDILMVVALYSAHNFWPTVYKNVGNMKSTPDSHVAEWICLSGFVLGAFISGQSSLLRGIYSQPDGSLEWAEAF